MKIDAAHGLCCSSAGTPTGAQWIGAALGPDGAIYCAPANAARVLRIDPADGSVGPIGDDLSVRVVDEGGGGSYEMDLKWDGAALGPDGAIYCAPANAPRVLRIDPATRTAAPWGGDLSEFGDYKWRSPTLAADGCIYCAPFCVARVLRIDPRGGRAAPIGDDLSSFGPQQKWSGAALAPDGRIYCAPFNADRVLCIDPAAQRAAPLGPSFGQPPPPPPKRVASGSSLRQLLWRHRVVIVM